MCHTRSASNLALPCIKRSRGSRAAGSLVSRLAARGGEEIGALAKQASRLGSADAGSAEGEASGSDDNEEEEGEGSDDDDDEEEEEEEYDGDDTDLGFRRRPKKAGRRGGRARGGAARGGGGGAVHETIDDMVAGCTPEILPNDIYRFELPHLLQRHKGPFAHKRDESEEGMKARIERQTRYFTTSAHCSEAVARSEFRQEIQRRMKSQTSRRQAHARAVAASWLDEDTGLGHGLDERYTVDTLAKLVAEVNTAISEAPKRVRRRPFNTREDQLIVAALLQYGADQYKAAQVLNWHHVNDAGDDMGLCVNLRQVVHIKDRVRAPAERCQCPRRFVPHDRPMPFHAGAHTTARPGGR